MTETFAPLVTLRVYKDDGASIFTRAEGTESRNAVRVFFFRFMLGGRASDWLVVITCGLVVITWGQSYSWQMTCANSEGRNVDD